MSCSSGAIKYRNYLEGVVKQGIEYSHPGPHNITTNLHHCTHSDPKTIHVRHGSYSGASTVSTQRGSAHLFPYFFPFPL